MTDDLHALAGAYALDAIDDAGERRSFEEHLAGCETCATELREFRAGEAQEEAGQGRGVGFLRSLLLLGGADDRER
ncbi:hypothetical protein AB0K37_42050, partial [Actinomadura sp. NPDC049753]